MTPLYLFDIDGTIANLKHRLHFIEQSPPDWREFFAHCADDEPIEDVIMLLRLLKRSGAQIFLVSGRSDEAEVATRQWLIDHDVWFDRMYMRRAGDHREDSIVKAELLNAIEAQYTGLSIAGVFEDRKQVVDMYRARGLRVYHVVEGSY